MSLENKIQELIDGLAKNTESHLGVIAAITAAGLKPKPTAAAAVRDEVIPEDEGDEAETVVAEPVKDKKPGRPKKDPAPAAKTYTADEVAAMAGKVKETFGKDKAVALIGEYTDPRGGKLSNIPEKKYGAFVTAAEALIAAGVQEDADDEESDEL